MYSHFFSLFVKSVCLPLIGSFVVASLKALPITRELPRIEVRSDKGEARFHLACSGEIFHPMGSSYLPELHRSFSPGVYDSAAADAALAQMAEGGLTVVRIWAYHGHWENRRDGIYALEGPQPFRTERSPELWQPYLDNLCDFIARANHYGIYVHLVIDREPDKNFYREMVNRGYPDVEGFHHREYMTTGSIEAKEIYIRELIGEIRGRNPHLLSTIFAYEIRNELHANTSQDPFKRVSGRVKTAAGIYDMGCPEERLACLEDNIQLFLKRTTRALREEEPRALATASVFAYLPVGKKGMLDEGLLPIDLPDTRWPVRPKVLVDTDLDFISFHGYIPHDWETALESSGVDAELVRKKPFICGEFGAHRRAFPNAGKAADALYLFRQEILESGFQGAYLFTWDSTQHTRWTMTEEGGAIFEALRVPGNSEVEDESGSVK